MCLLAIFHRVVPDVSLVVGANREEYYARGGEPLQLQTVSCKFVAGRDPHAGGTWLGINVHGLVAAVTNRRKSNPPASPRSRGLLTRDLLQCENAAQARTVAVRALTDQPYAGCNLFLADRERAVVIHGGEWLHVTPLPPGVHVLTSTGDVNDGADPRVAHALAWLHGRRYQTAADCLAALKELCGQTALPCMCLHGPERGTVSSTILVLRSDLAQSLLWHAQGPPDTTPYADYAHLLRTLNRS